MRRTSSVNYHVSATFISGLRQVSIRRRYMSDGELIIGSMKFESVQQVDVPKGRDGKHKQIVQQLLNDLAQVTAGMALKVPLDQLPDTKENIRSALSRAARQDDINLATSSDEKFLYIWKTDK